MREEAAGMRVYQPGEEVLEASRPATAREYAPGSGPLDAPPQPPRRQVGRRIDLLERVVRSYV